MLRTHILPMCRVCLKLIAREKVAPCEQFMGGRKGQLLKAAHGESARQCLQLPTSVAGDKEFSRQRTPRDQTLSKIFLLTLFLGHDFHNRQLWDFLGDDLQHDDCVQQTLTTRKVLGNHILPGHT